MSRLADEWFKLHAELLLKYPEYDRWLSQHAKIGYRLVPEEHREAFEAISKAYKELKARIEAPE